jgi:hypothetical protein
MTGVGEWAVFQAYLRKIEAARRLGNDTEHTHRPALQALLEALNEGIAVTNEPKRIACGAADLVVTRKRDARVATVSLACAPQPATNTLVKWNGSGRWSQLPARSAIYRGMAAWLPPVRLSREAGATARSRCKLTPPRVPGEWRGRKACCMSVGIHAHYQSRSTNPPY